MEECVFFYGTQALLLRGRFLIGRGRVPAPPPARYNWRSASHADVLRTTNTRVCAEPREKSVQAAEQRLGLKSRRTCLFVFGVFFSKKKETNRIRVNFDLRLEHSAYSVSGSIRERNNKVRDDDDMDSLSSSNSSSVFLYFHNSVLLSSLRRPTAP